MCPYPFTRTITAAVDAIAGAAASTPVPFVSPITAGKVSEYDFRFAKAGANVPDSTGSGHTLIPGSGAAQPGASSQGAVFSGAQQYTDGTTVWLNPADAYSFVLCLNPSVIPQIGGVIGQVGNAFDFFNFYIGAQAGTGASGSAIAMNADEVGHSGFGNVLVSGSWVMLTLYSTGAVVNLATNNAVVAPDPTTVSIKAETSGTNYIGTQQDGSGTNFFSGTIAYVGIYSATLSTANIQTIYTAMKAAMAASGINLP